MASFSVEIKALIHYIMAWDCCNWEGNIQDEKAFESGLSGISGIISGISGWCRQK